MGRDPIVTFNILPFSVFRFNIVKEINVLEVLRKCKYLEYKVVKHCKLEEKLVQLVCNEYLFKLKATGVSDWENPPPPPEKKSIGRGGGLSYKVFNY